MRRRARGHFAVRPFSLVRYPSAGRRFLGFCLSSCLGALLPALPVLTCDAWADDGFWSKGGGGSWASAANWDSGIIADGEDNTAYFGLSLEPAIPANATFTLDGARSIGNLDFTTSTGPDAWLLNAGSGGPLTLDATYNAPYITVNLASQQVTLNVALAGTNGMEKFGDGTLALNSTNTYTGQTTVSGGTLLVNGWLGQDGVDVASGTLSGTGVITGPVIVELGSALSPGPALGALTISNSLTLQPGSTTFMDINASTLAHDTVRGLPWVSYAGTLVVSNWAGTLVLGKSFALFNATIATGNFSAITPNPGSGLRWRFDPGSGVLSVVSSTSRPIITGITLTGNGLVLQATNGPPGAGNCLVASTNLTLPKTNWSSIATNVFDVTGNLNITNIIDPGLPQRFFLLSVLPGP